MYRKIEQIDKVELGILLQLKLNALFSNCIYHKVGAALANSKREIGQIAINKVFNGEECKDGGCQVGISCRGAIHAEEQLKAYNDYDKMWITTMPCEACQRHMYLNGIKEVHIFRKTPKRDIGILDIVEHPDPFLLLEAYNKNHNIDQFKVAMGEMGEFITAVSDRARDDREELNRDVEKEEADVLIQLLMLNRESSLLIGEAINKLVKLTDKFSNVTQV